MTGREMLQPRPRLVVAASGRIRGRRGMVLRGVSSVRHADPAARADVADAFDAGLARGGGRWWAELGRLNRAEQDTVRRAVAARITYDCASPGVFIRAALRSYHARRASR